MDDERERMSRDSEIFMSLFMSAFIYLFWLQKDSYL